MLARDFIYFAFADLRFVFCNAIIVASRKIEQSRVKCKTVSPTKF